MTRSLIPAISSGPFEATPTGLTIRHKDVPFELWRAYGEGLKRVEGAIQWVIGDWLVYGDAEYGEIYSQALEMWPEAEYTALSNYKTTAEKVSKRLESLSWAHHFEVRRLEPAEQSEWLTKAEANNWSVRDLRRAIQAKTPRKDWLQLYNLWHFDSPDPAFGHGHPGNIPGQVNMNLNYYLTEPGELIVDLFAGGGTTLDVCAEENDDYGNRKCLSFDRKPVRKEIGKWDLTDGLPDFPDAAMVFLDPPYWGQKAGEYSGDATDLANMPLEQFNKTLGAVVGASLKRARCVALIIGATQKDGQFYDHAAWLMGAFGAPRHRFQVPYSTEQYKAFDVVRAKKNKTYLNVCRDLMIWQS